MKSPAQWAMRDMHVMQGLRTATMDRLHASRYCAPPDPLPAGPTTQLTAQGSRNRRNGARQGVQSGACPRLTSGGNGQERMGFSIPHFPVSSSFFLFFKPPGKFFGYLSKSASPFPPFRLKSFIFNVLSVGKRWGKQGETGGNAGETEGRFLAFPPRTNPLPVRVCARMGKGGSGKDQCKTFSGYFPGPFAFMSSISLPDHSEAGSLVSRFRSPGYVSKDTFYSVSLGGSHWGRFGRCIKARSHPAMALCQPNSVTWLTCQTELTKWGMIGGCLSLVHSYRT